MTGIDVTPAVRAAAEAVKGQRFVSGGTPATLADAAVTAALPHLAEQFARLVEARDPNVLAPHDALPDPIDADDPRFGDAAGAPW